MNHRAFFKKHGKAWLKPEGAGSVDIRINDLYDAFKARLQDETNLLNCTCAEERKTVVRPGGWVCPVHGSVTEF